MSDTPRKKPLIRYRVQQDKGKYCLKGCEDGDLVDYSEYASLERELSASQSRVRELEGENERLTKDAERWRWIMSMGSVRVVKYDNFDNMKYLCAADIDAALAGPQQERGE